MKKHWYKYLVYASLLFLIYALYKADYLTVPRIYSYPALCSALFFLCIGMLCDALAWHTILRTHNIPVHISESIASKGLSVFAKFIPGKVWVVVGPAKYISEKTDTSLGTVSKISLDAQFILLWTGLSLGAVGMFCVNGMHKWGWLVLLAWCGLTTVIFVPLLHTLAEHAFSYILKRKITIPRLHPFSIIKILPPFIFFWLFLSFGFYFLMYSTGIKECSIMTGLAFPLAASLGIIAIIAPGGIGAREAVLAGYLVLAGVDLKDATSVAVVARVWFLIGEIFIFIIGILADRRVKQIENQNNNILNCKIE